MKRILPVLVLGSLFLLVIWAHTGGNAASEANSNNDRYRLSGDNWKTALVKQGLASSGSVPARPGIGEQSSFELSLAGGESLRVYMFAGIRVPHSAYQKFGKAYPDWMGRFELIGLRNTLLIYERKELDTERKPGVPAKTAHGEAIRRAVDSLRGDEVVDTHGQIDNLERWNRFTTNVAVKIADAIRITGITVEGDPVYKDVTFDGSMFQVTFDNSEDSFAGEKQIVSYSCKQLQDQRDTSGGRKVRRYELAGCTAAYGNIPLLTIEDR